MRSAVADKVMVIWIAAALAVWICCLVVLWHLAFDASGESTLVAISATLLAVAFTAGLPGRLVRTVRAVGRWFGFRKALTVVPGAAGPERSRPQEVRATMRLLAAAAILAAAGGLVSMGAIYLGEKLADALPRVILLSSTAWMVFKLAVQFVGMLPIAAGLSLGFLVGGMVRTGGGRDIYASLFREWVWGTAIGFGVFGICWWAGFNVWALAATMTVVLVGGAGGILQREGVTTRPVCIQRPVETPSRRRRLGIAGGFGVLTLAILLQLRLMGDAVGIGLGGGACWAGISLGLLGWSLHIADRKSHPPGRRQRVGATVGVCGGLLLQGALLVSASVGGASGAICLIFAAGLQIPVAALGGLILSRQRRLFAYAGGRARDYFCCASTGAGVAILGYLIVASIPAGPLIVLVVALGLCAVDVVAGIAQAKRPDGQLKWASAGVVLLCALTAAMLGAIHDARERFGSVRPGIWLTGVGGSNSPNRAVRTGGVLPHPLAWRGEGIDRALGGILAGTGGRWVAAIPSRAELPPVMPGGVHITVCPPDPSAVWPRWWTESAAVVGRTGFFAVGRHVRGRFDGALLAPVPADHPQAWRCYSEQTMRHFLSCLHPDGVSVLRLRVRSSGMGVALAAAKGFHNAVGPCWVAFECRDGQVDMLLAGPADRVPRPWNCGDLIVFSARTLWYEWSGHSPMRLTGPKSDLLSEPTIREFANRLESRRD